MLSRRAGSNSALKLADGGPDHPLQELEGSEEREVDREKRGEWGKEERSAHRLISMGGHTSVLSVMCTSSLMVIENPSSP